MKRRIFLDDPNVGDLEKKYVNNAIDKGFVSTFGTFVKEFEKNLRDFLRAQYSIATQSGTSAIYIALFELGIGKGDEVIIPALSFIATANPVVYCGAKPVFVDVDKKTWNICPKEIEKKITKKTRAIIPVHLYGNPADMKEIMKISRKHRLHVIEDAAEALGAEYEGKSVGTFGDFGCYSFNGNKIITTGGGGMIVGKSKKHIDHIGYLVDQAKDTRVKGFHSQIGFNFRMTNIEASLGLAQLKRLKYFLKRKQSINKIYRRELDGVENVSFQYPYENAKSSNWLTCIRIDGGVDINKIHDALLRCNIKTRRIFMPMVTFPFFKAGRKYFKNSFDTYYKGLCLPSSTLNKDSDIEFVCRKIKELL